MEVSVRFYVDPSFSSTGITCVLIEDGKPKRLMFGLVNTDREKKHSYNRYRNRALQQVAGIVEFCKEFERVCDHEYWSRKIIKRDDCRACVEIPPTYGFTAAPLWGLSFLLTTKLSDRYKVYSILPSEVQKFCKKRGLVSHSKRWKLGQLYLEALKEKYPDMEIVGERLFTSGKQDDVATSFLFFVMHKLGIMQVGEIK